MCRWVTDVGTVGATRVGATGASSAGRLSRSRRLAQHVAPSPAFSLHVELRCEEEAVAEAIDSLEGAGFQVRRTPGSSTLVVATDSEPHLRGVDRWLRGRFGAELVSCTDRVLDVHRGGKIWVHANPFASADDALAMATGTSTERPEGPAERNTRRGSVAIVTDGSAVLGLGDLGPSAALPVMEGKAMLFDQLAHIDAVPICVRAQSVGAIVNAVVSIAGSFDAINLEDIAAPRCFEVEKQLRSELSIPVMHDDQHGTAVVVLAALTNALFVVGLALGDARIVVAGAGAASTAVTRFLLAAGAKDVVVWTRGGVLGAASPSGLSPEKSWLAQHTNPRAVTGGLARALVGADVFIGLSGPNLITVDDLELMAPDRIVFTLANPVPEIAPALVRGHAAVLATGSSDYPNQVNNALAFPGIFRGALDVGALAISAEMLVAASAALAALVGPDIGAQRILPDVLDPRVVPAVADAVREAHGMGTARPSRP